MNNIYFCPVCKGTLKDRENALICGQCNITYQVKMGIPILLESGVDCNEDWADAASLVGYEFDSFSQIKHQEFLSFLKPRYARTLDVGCGGGASSSVIETISDIIYGIDLSLKGLLVFKERHISNSFPIKASVYNLPFPDSYFDLIISLAVIEHLKNPSTMIKEVKRVLKPAGHFLIRNDALMHGILERLRMLPGSIGRPPGHDHVNMITPRKLGSILIKHDFTVLKKWYLPLSKVSKYLNVDFLSPVAIKGQFLCTIDKQ